MYISGQIKIIAKVNLGSPLECYASCMSSTTCGMARLDMYTGACKHGKIGSLAWVHKEAIPTFIANEDQYKKINGGKIFSGRIFSNGHISKLSFSDCFEKLGQRWIPRLDTRSCYTITLRKAVFEQSRKFCTENGGELTTTLDESEARFVQGIQ